MNGKKVACIILLKIIACLAYGGQVMQQRTKAMLEEAANAETDAKNAETQFKMAETEVINLKFKTQDLRQFLKDWEPVIKRVQSEQDADQAIMSLVKNSRILTLNQKTNGRENRENKVVPRTLQGTLIVQDDYAKTMNWLGELERKLPLMRISSARLKQGETGRQVNLEIHFDIPIVNLDSQMEEKK
jgi:hypothetical protein